MKTALQIRPQTQILNHLKQNGYLDVAIKDKTIDFFRVLPFEHSFHVPRVETPTSDGISKYLKSSEVAATIKFAQTLSPDISLIDQHETNLIKTSILPKQTKNADERFQRLQRERKIWWMKHTSNPCSLAISEIERTTEDMQKVSIVMQSELGDKIKLESISFAGGAEIVLQNCLHMREACFGLLENAVDNDTLDINRKLAPVQVCIFYNLDNVDGMAGDLQQLGRLVLIKMMKAGIRVLNSGSFEVMTNSRNVYGLADAIGIPYGLQLEAESLQNGIVKLRNRKTKIFETIHVSDIPGYLVKILQA